MRISPPRADTPSGRKPPSGTPRNPGHLAPASSRASGVEGSAARPTPARKQLPRTDQRVLLTLDQVLAELGGLDGPLPRSTWHAWQRKGTGPKTIKLPNGQTRVARDDLNAWLDSLTRDPAAP